VRYADVQMLRTELAVFYNCGSGRSGLSARAPGGIDIWKHCAILTRRQFVRAAWGVAPSSVVIYALSSIVNVIVAPVLLGGPTAAMPGRNTGSSAELACGEQSAKTYMTSVAP
jgi:hypothetical protein